MGKSIGRQDATALECLLEAHNHDEGFKTAQTQSQFKTARTTPKQKLTEIHNTE